MDTASAHMLNRVNTRFYLENAQSFSQTRHASWAGWEQALQLLGASQPPRSGPDLACGNQRFEAFLAQRYPGAQISARCIDSCGALVGQLAVPSPISVEFEQRDIVDQLLEGGALQLPSAQLAVCFGFMHHVPGSTARKQLLQELFRCVEPGGCLAVSFWQFLEEESLAQRAQETTRTALAELGLDAAELEQGDCLLGWQGAPGAWRYCHSFTAKEVEGLAQRALQASGRTAQLSFFEADGRNGRLNRYLLARLG